MKRFPSLAAAAFLLVVPVLAGVAAQDGEMRTERVEFKPGAESSTPAPPGSDRRTAWTRVEMMDRPHAPLLERQGVLGAGVSKRPPVSLALLVLEPDLVGLVTGVTAGYDTMERPSEVAVTVTEEGILDDDLLGVRHVLTLARNANDEWRIVGYQRGELRRRHFLP